MIAVRILGTLYYGVYYVVHVLRGPRRLWSRWPLRAARASVSRHASAGHHGSAVRACLGSYRARAHCGCPPPRLSLDGTSRLVIMTSASSQLCLMACILLTQVRAWTLLASPPRHSAVRCAAIMQSDDSISLAAQFRLGVVKQRAGDTDGALEAYQVFVDAAEDHGAPPYTFAEVCTH